MIIGHGPCTYLLLLLLGFILLSPYLEEGIFARTLLGILSVSYTHLTLPTILLV